MDPIFKKLNFGSLLIQTTPKHMCDFQFYILILLKHNIVYFSLLQCNINFS